MVKITSLDLLADAAIDGTETLPVVKGGQSWRARLSALVAPLMTAALAARDAAQAAMAGAQSAAASVPARNYASVAAALADGALGVDQVFSVGSGASILLYRRTASAPYYANVYFNAATVGLSPAGNVQDMLDPALRRLARLPQNIAAMGGMHCCLLDSLTDGAGSLAPLTWRVLYYAIMRANLGYGGPGYQGHNLGTANEAGASFYRTGASEIGIDAGTAPGTTYCVHSPHGGGNLLTGAGSYYTWIPEAQWKSATFFYLKGPDLGGLRINDVGNTGTPTIIDCYAATYQLAYLTLTNPVGASGGAYGHRFDWTAGATNPTGPVVTFGADYIYDALKFRPYNMATGGRKAATVAGLNAASFATFIAQCAPKVVWLDCGMNDRTISNASAFSGYLTTIVGLFQQVTAVKPLITLVQALDPADAASNNWPSYTAVRQSVANTLGCAYYDDRHWLGLPDYTTANALGFMADAIHPNGKANIARAQQRARFLGAGAAAVDPGKLAYAGSGGSAAKIYTGTLTQKESVALTAPVSAVTGFSATMSGNTLTVTGSGSGSFTQGQLITGTNIPSATFITGFGTGTGGTGTYTVSTSATVASAVAITGYTVTPVTLFNLGMGNPYNSALVRLNVTAGRAGTSAMRRQRIDFELTNANIYNSAGMTGAVQQTDEFSTTAGDGQTIAFAIRVPANGNLAQVTITSLNYAGAATVTGSYVFAAQSYTGAGIIEN
ncbi:hypothetical protein [Novosphingobium sp. KACC 22771]|uniref:hypothetical protein n=1 Tax=Novosphingobium sp. KACC 22771 TaxID=3025670 RepID=UPI002365F72F|nr:hypothetical protein [Novosphingobium sp. KACC 22771]WDF71483.1 hypothetical protein PQ467_11765 [Novosphingobium sp. KACC 22771]